jgi:hypothetical protein
MFLVQLFLPARTPQGATFPKPVFDELAQRFGGVTAYLRAPALGLWENDDGECVRDEVLLFEVVADALEREWWGDYRRLLEKRFGQDEILVRATRVDKL